MKLIDEDKPNPYKPHLWGRPTFVIVVADKQYENPQDDFGMARFQAEIAAYHFPKQVLGEPVKAQKPYAFFNDHMDQSRIAAADGFVPLLPLTDDEEAERKLPEKIRRENLPKIPEGERQRAIQAHDFWLETHKEAEEEKDSGRFEWDGSYFR